MIPIILPLAQSIQNTVVVPQMEGVTTVLAGFIFVCVCYPKLVKNKTQFYAAFAMVAVIILLFALSVMLKDSAGFQVFAGAITGLLQLGAFVLLFLSAGGITMKELAGEMGRAYEVMRRGEEEKTVIVPLTGEMPKPRQQPGETRPPAATGTESAPSVEKIDLPPKAGWPTQAPQSKPPPPDSSIPLE
jgi:hypothetical protein